MELQRGSQSYIAIINQTYRRNPDYNRAYAMTVLQESRETGERGRVRESSDRQDCVEDIVPNLARHTEPKVEVLVMVSKVVLLHLLHVGGEAGVVQSRPQCERSEELRTNDELTHSACNHTARLV